MNKLFNINLNRDTDKYLYLQLYDEIKHMILNLEIKPHYKLPPIRKLSKELEVNNITVVNAYKLLEQNDLIYKKVGSGSYVNEIENHIYSSNEVVNQTYNEEKSLRGTKENNVFNFAQSTPSTQIFPISDFKSVINEVLDRDKGNAFIYQEGQGYYPLRDSIMKYLKKQSIITSLDNIQIVSGAQQAIDILSKTLIDYGDIVITETPTYQGAIAAFKSRGARIIEIPITENGMDIKFLENKLRNFSPKFIYVMPNFQNPTGYTYSDENKNALLELANKYNVHIIEDDYMSEISFKYNNKTLKSLDVNDNVIYIKSFSKILMPGLRLGFVVIPGLLKSDVLLAKYTTDISTSTLIQRAFELFIKKGFLYKHIDNIKVVYNERFNKMLYCLKNYLPEGVAVTEPSGGLNFWISLPSEFYSNGLYNLCSENNILIMPGSNFFTNKNNSNHFRLSIASVETDDIEKGIRELSNLIEKFITCDKNKGNIYRPFKI